LRLIRDALLTHYKLCADDWAMDLNVDVGDVPYLPEIARGDELDDLVRITRIHLSATECEIGFELDVAWFEEDDEHGGLGVRLEDYEYASVGPVDNAHVS
jgi:hypothetical protein